MIPDEIERVALLGWCLFPVSAYSKAAAFRVEPGQPTALDQATSDLATLDRWAHEYPSCGWRVVAAPSRLFILDVDRPGVTHAADGFAALAGLVAKHGALPPRPMTRTGGSGGAALFFEWRGEPLRGQSGYPGLDPHRGRQAIMIPPSRHPVTGGAYTWRVPPWECSPPPIPGWLATLLRPPPPPPVPQWEPTAERAMTAVLSAVQAVSGAADGDANNTLNAQAFRLGRGWCQRGLLSSSDAESALMSAAMQRRIPVPEARATIQSGLKGGMRAA